MVYRPCAVFYLAEWILVERGTGVPGGIKKKAEPKVYQRMARSRRWPVKLRSTLRDLKSFCFRK